MRISDWSSDVCSSDLHDLEEMPVDVDGVAHHAVVDEVHPDPFVTGEADRLGAFVQLLPVARPHEALHVAGEVDVDASGRLAFVRERRNRRELVIGEDAVRHPQLGRASGRDRVSQYGYNQWVAVAL